MRIPHILIETKNKFLSCLLQRYQILCNNFKLRPVGRSKLTKVMHVITFLFSSWMNFFSSQIALVDLLTEIGIVPDGIIGHSVGELGCAYADGCLTAEQMILAAYYRGLASLETEFIRGSMASIGKCRLLDCTPGTQVANIRVLKNYILLSQALDMKLPNC